MTITIKILNIGDDFRTSEYVMILFNFKENSDHFLLIIYLATCKVIINISEALNPLLYS